MSFLFLLYKQRGKGNSDKPVIILEEAAFLDPIGFINVIVPIMNMKQAVLIGISSPSYNKMNYYHKMQQIKNPITKKRLALSVEAIVACDDCIKKNIAEWCRHFESMRPSWQSLEAVQTSVILLNELGQGQAAARELSGIISMGEGRVFNTKSIEKLSKRPLFVTSSCAKPTHVGIFVDPNAGGESEMAIISVCLVNSVLVVCIFLSFYFFYRRRITVNSLIKQLF